MKRIVAVSDTHLQAGSMVPRGVADLAKGADLLLHAGDFVTLQVYDAFCDLGPLVAVCGNSDSPEVKAILPKRRVIEVEGVKIGIVHQASHFADTTGAAFLAREMDVDALVFGHLHRPVVEQGPRLLISPGSPTEPRLSAPSAAEIEVDGVEIRGRILPLGRPICGYFKYAESLAEGSEEERREGGV
ncbi:metallophosphoesterase [Candidatus Methanocrinis natronophilus]|uniref:Phosphoesterase n=1 Tax=Candidatus Methanocrinis natronophilus TaxID=3033396 RepID=A0ABT5X7T8_9EURY|nr:metallophosphoesterase [Candidatus Methanocrinis natronophilus]MDF0590765.1 metallophosphoesterase [Candidatus Methanocrinis natronophilus]